MWRFQVREVEGKECLACHFYSCSCTPKCQFFLWFTNSLYSAIFFFFLSLTVFILSPVSCCSHSTGFEFLCRRLDKCKEDAGAQRETTARRKLSRTVDRCSHALTLTHTHKKSCTCDLFVEIHTCTLVNTKSYHSPCLFFPKDTISFKVASIQPVCNT